MTPKPSPSTPSHISALFGTTDDRDLQTPPGTQSLGMWLFLIALAILFIAGLLAYIMIRIMGTRETIAPSGAIYPATAPPLHTMTMPIVLWLSTAAILLSSYTIHRAIDNVRHEHQDKFRQSLTATLLLAVPFFLAQAMGMGMLLKNHMPAQTGELVSGGVSGAVSGDVSGGALYRAVVFLVIVHALHVLGGLIPLAVITKRAHDGRYDHEYYTPVLNVSRYWHFLDLVWLMLFSTFLILG